MKRYLNILLSLLLLLSLAACKTRPQSPVISEEPLPELVLLPDEAQDSGTSGQSAEQLPPDDGGGGTLSSEQAGEAAQDDLPEEKSLPEDGSYTSKEDVALYLHLYGHLPGNFITKKQAEALGWQGGSLEPYAPGKCIGGNRFGNYEGQLPDASGRRWTECDVDTLGAKSRGAKRIVFSNDGLIYYTEDHYQTFELLYGEG
ncbi:MAG: ribonuclease [Oscillospiraceae bacterium]|nr:ribonuclease [Oscillospiraceae bacterium]